MDEILEKLEKKLRTTFKKVTLYSEENGMDMRTAAFAIAIERIEKAYILRGIFP
jgi:glutamate dehydrogenase (NAD(P)+)